MDRHDNDDTSPLLPWQADQQPGTYRTSGGPRPARRWWPWVIVVVLAIVLAGIGGWLAAGGPSQPQAAATTTGSPGATATGSTPAAVAPQPSATTGAASAAATTRPGRCHTGALSVAWGPGQGAAGTSYETLVFTNTSGQACDMYGFPGMEPVDAGGNQIQLTVVRSTDVPRLIMLAPGAHAWALVHWSQVTGPYTGPACTPGAAGLVVTPPDETTQLHLPGALRICGYGTITTGPVLDHLPIGA